MKFNSSYVAIFIATSLGATAEASPCCNISAMDGSTCPSGLVAFGDGGIMDGAGISTACCPPDGPNVMSASNPSCEGFVPGTTSSSGGDAFTMPAVPNTDPISSGGFMDGIGGSTDNAASSGGFMDGMGGSTDNTSASSSTSMYCSEDLIQQFPDCKTCLYSCNDGEPKQCAFGFAGDCSPNCVNFSTGGINEEHCLIPSSGSDSNMFGDSGNSNDPSSATVHKMGVAIVAAVGAAVGYVVML